MSLTARGRGGEGMLHYSIGLDERIFVHKKNDYFHISISLNMCLIEIVLLSTHNICFA